MKLISILLTFLIILIADLSAQTAGFLKVPDGIIHYKVFGEGPPLLFLNGGPGFSSDSYEGMADHLKSKRQVILFDQRGTGKSEMKEVSSKTITSAKMVEDIEALKNHLEIKAWDIIGQSFGGVYAMYYADRYPKSINKLILTFTLAPRKDKFQDFEYVNFYKGKSFKAERVIDSVYTEAIETAQQKIRTLEQSDSLERKRNERIISECKSLRRRGLSARYFVYQRKNIPIAIDWFINKAKQNNLVFKLANRSFNLYEIKDSLKKYDKEVLILHGQYDFIRLKAPRILHKIFSNARLEIIKNSGHLIWMDQPKITKKLILDFLE